jgi:hypothetical protein
VTATSRSSSDSGSVARPASRRDRQILEIAALIAAGHHERAAGLALEHAAEFADDADLLARMDP